MTLPRGPAFVRVRGASVCAELVSQFPRAGGAGLVTPLVPEPPMGLCSESDDLN